MPETSTDRRLPLTMDQAQHMIRDINTSYSKLDEALAQTLQTSVRMVEISMSIGLDPASAQRILADMSRCTDAILNSRGNLIAAHEKAHRVRKRSVVADEDHFGCPRVTADAARQAPAEKVVAITAAA